MAAKFGSLDHFTAWIAVQSRETSYETAAGAHCLVCRYGEAHGVGGADDPATYSKTHALMDIDGAYIDYITSGMCNSVRDFENATKRAVYYADARF